MAKVENPTISIVGTLTAGNGTQRVEVYENDYEKLINKPSIGGVPLQGDMVLTDLGSNIPDQALTNSEIEALINGIT